jgi:hypothetical protein
LEEEEEEVMALVEVDVDNEVAVLAADLATAAFAALTRLKLL